MMRMYPPMLQCPYCHYTGTPRIYCKIAPGGWVWFAVCLLIGLLFLFSLWPVAYAGMMGDVGVFFIVIGIVGLFITRRTYACNSCGITLGKIQ